MSTVEVAVADPDIAAATLTAHMDDLWASGHPERNGWKRTRLDPLRWVVEMPAHAPDGEEMNFFVLVDGRCYDLHPPDVLFVRPDDWQPATEGRWWPKTDPAGDSPADQWFGLHPAYPFDQGRRPGQLICFSFTLGYYQSDHAPTEEQTWTQGRHTVAATLSRVADILSPTYFRGAS